MDDSNFDFEEEEKKVQAAKGKYKRMRALKQFRDLSDDEFQQKISQKALGIEVSQEFEKQIEKKMAEFAEDYDLSDLKINDRDSLRALIQAHLALERYEQQMFMVHSGKLDNEAILQTDKLSKVMSDLRSDISKLQDDLSIKRKARKSDQDVSVMAYIESLKDKAKRFKESKESYIFCEKCNMLLATVWSLYPDEDRNKMAFVCNRVLEDGTKCNHKTVIGTKELLANRGTNKPEITPESML